MTIGRNLFKLNPDDERAINLNTRNPSTRDRRNKNVLPSQVRRVVLPEQVIIEADTGVVKENDPTAFADSFPTTDRVLNVEKAVSGPAINRQSIITSLDEPTREVFGIFVDLKRVLLTISTEPSTFNFTSSILAKFITEPVDLSVINWNNHGSLALATGGGAIALTARISKEKFSMPAGPIPEAEWIADNPLARFEPSNLIEEKISAFIPITVFGVLITPSLSAPTFAAKARFELNTVGRSPIDLLTIRRRLLI